MSDTQAEALRIFRASLTGHALTTSEKAAVLIVLDRCADELERLTEWQPIETAPRNGRTILAYKPSGLALSARQDVVPVHWTGWGGGAWENSTSGHKIFDALTHWMPLPAPPNP